MDGLMDGHIHYGWWNKFRHTFRFFLRSFLMFFWSFWGFSINENDATASESFSRSFWLERFWLTTKSTLVFDTFSDFVKKWKNEVWQKHRKNWWKSSTMYVKTCPRAFITSYYTYLSYLRPTRCKKMMFKKFAKFCPIMLKTKATHKWKSPCQ